MPDAIDFSLTLDSDPRADTSATAALAADLRARLHAVRADSETLVAPLSAKDACVQSMPDASPAKWHLAHTTWFFETFVLAGVERSFAPVHAGYRSLFNSYYDAIGAHHPRPQRGLLTRPSLCRRCSTIAIASLCGSIVCSRPMRRRCARWRWSNWGCSTSSSIRN